MNVRLDGVPAAEVVGVWAYVEPWVRAASSELSSWTTEDWCQRVESGDAQLWLVVIDDELTGVVITEVYKTIAGMTCGIPIAGGARLAESLSVALETIEKWAKEVGCVLLQADGCRSGWIRVLEREGWQPVSVQVAKAI